MSVAGRERSRAADERILAWVAARCAGRRTIEIAAHWGVSEMTVRVATNKVRSEDVEGQEVYW
jgi:transposase